MADLDAALDREHALAIGRRVAFDDVADVGDDIRLGQIATPVDACVVEVDLVRAADEVAHRRHRAVGDDLDRLLQVVRAEVAGLAAEVCVDLGTGREAKAFVQARHLARLDLVQRMVAAHQQQPDGRADHVAGGVGLVGGKHERLHRPLQRHAEQLRHVFAGRLARRRSLHEIGGRHGARFTGRNRLRHLDVGRVVGRRAVDDRVFAGVGDDLELVRTHAADRAVVGRDRAEGQAHALEDARVGGEHDVVALARRLDVAIERVRILHRELAPAHQPKTRPAFVTELGLDVIEILRQRAVAAQFLAGDVGDDFFAGRLDHEVAVVAVFQPHQLGAVFLEAPGFPPQLGRLHDRHQ